MSTAHPKAALFGNTGPGGEVLEEVYGAKRLEHIAQVTDIYPTKITSKNIEQCLPDLRDLEVIFSTWGMFPLTPGQLDAMPKLRALFYAAGTVGYFARPLLERGVRIVSAVAANAVPVAEFTVGQILLANKGYWRSTREYAASGNHLTAFCGRGNYGATISVLGAGQIGRRVVEFLRPFCVKVLVFDPYLGDQAAESMGVEKVTLQEAFARGDVVSNHLANVPQTMQTLNGALFASMPKNATFINTGRGQTVHEGELIQVLRERPDLTALLDVTEPEPCPVDSPTRALPNVVVTPHIAGSRNDEIGRMSDMVLGEFEAWKAGQPLHHEVTLRMLDTMA